MTLEEAIKESNKLKEEFYEIFDEQEHKAIQLGIEALKLIQRQSPNRTLPGTELLPGETAK